ncbi:MAG TPA: HAMP domain-containing sensor histidine kinase [Actinomycetota bacterium]|nr:HAMP domain-containing sensor histidine kinase [Actinomycetota bacterium]
MSAVRDASDFHSCSHEIRSLLRRDELGVRFFFEDRAGRLRSAYRFGHPIDLGRRLVVLRRQALTGGRTRFLEDHGRVAGVFPIGRFGDVIGVAEVSTLGRSLRLRRLDLERTIARLSERLQRNAELDRQRRTLDIGLAWMAHELRGPLLAARLSLENTADEMDPTDARPIVRAADELSRLAAGLDSILRLAVGNGTIEPRRVDLMSLIRDAAGCCVAEAGDDRVVIEARDRLAVVADPLHLRSAIENLIRNALSYSTPGTTVMVLVEPREDHIVVDVQNEGSGVRPDDRERIFEPLVHGRRAAGTGLGLFVARRVIERHGGTIRYHEPRDGLSSFELRLPAKESA